MNIISNELIPNEQILMSTNDFLQKASSEEGITIDDPYAININDINSDIYNELKEDERFSFFSLNDNVPDWAQGVIDWSHKNVVNESNSNESVNINNLDPNTLEKVKTLDNDTSNIPQQVVQPPVISSPPAQSNIQNNQQTNVQAQPQVQTEPIQQKNVQPTQEKVLSLYNLPIVDDRNISTNQPQPTETSQRKFFDTAQYLSDDDDLSPRKPAQIYTFGSSKGGVGKTFTTVMATYRYAKTHPEEKIALIDFDIVDGAIGTVMGVSKPTLFNYLKEYVKGNKDIGTMHKYIVHGSRIFPTNVDIYIPPSNGRMIKNINPFWKNVISNVISNYDVVVFDTGIDYLNIGAISYVYKLANKIILISTLQSQAVASVSKQFAKLTGQSHNKVYSANLNLKSKINLAVTQVPRDSLGNEEMSQVLFNQMPCIAIFGIITGVINRVTLYGQYNYFDDNPAFVQLLDNLMDPHVVTMEEFKASHGK